MSIKRILQQLRDRASWPPPPERVWRAATEADLRPATEADLRPATEADFLPVTAEHMRRWIPAEEDK